MAAIQPLNRSSHQLTGLPNGLAFRQTIVLSIAVLLCTLSSGCMGLRIPRIDPSGERIFLPYPEQSTTLTLPLHGDNASSPFTGPAFETPPAPPPCYLNANVGGPTAIVAPQFVDDCAVGPPAVLTGGHIQARDLLHLPEKGKRGRIMLTPQRVVAPVGGEVILLAGVCGNDGYLMTGEPIEWMVSPDSVGNIVQIGDDDRCKIHKLVSNKPATEKVDGDFARGRTSTKPALITRGTRSTRDDVALKKGETWLSLSSPSEGVSRITVLAPESDCWDHRKATTTIYWIDANWMFPEPQTIPAGRPTRLITRVTRSDMNIPAEGWIVRYQMLTPTLGGFAPDGRSDIEVRVNGQGEAPVDVLPAPNQSGQAVIDIQVIRPAESDFPRLILKNGQTSITWSAPKLELRAGGDEIAGFDQPVTIHANVSNPGDLPAENVTLEAQLPPGVTFVGSTVENENTPNRVRWVIRDASMALPARTQLDVDVTVRARGPFQLDFVARGSNVPQVVASVRVDVYQPSMRLQVRPVNERVDVGQDAEFEIELTNLGSRPLSALRLQADGGSGMTHLQTAKNSVVLDYDQPALPPNQTWRKSVTFRVMQPGQQCVRILAMADAAQQETASACVIGLNAPAPTPSIIARITAEPVIGVGEYKIITMQIANNGRIPLTNVRIVGTYDTLVMPMQADQGVDESARDRFQLQWNLPQLNPGQEQSYRAQIQGLTMGESTWLLTVRAAEGAEATDAFKMRVVQGVNPNPAAPIPPTNRGDVLPNRSPSDITPPGSGIGNAGGGLQIEVTDRQDPALVQENIPYLLAIKNNRNSLDDSVQVRIRVPESFEVVQVNQVGGGMAQSPNFAGNGVIDLPVINTMRPGEEIQYELIFRTNLPQRAQIRVEASSRNSPQGVIDTDETEIRAR